MKKSKAVGVSFLWLLLFTGIQSAISVAASTARSLAYGIGSGNFLDMEAMLKNVGEVVPPVLVISNIVTALVFFVIIRFSQQDCIDNGLLKKVSPMGLPVSFVYLAAFSVVLGELLELLPLDSLSTDVYNSIIEALSTDNILTVIATIVLAPLCEELVFRGAIFSTLRKSFSFTGAAVLSSLFFSAAHMNLIQSTYVFVVGLLLCLIYKRFNSLWCCVAAHIGFNLFGGYIQFGGFSKPIYITALAVSTVIVAGVTLWLVFTAEKSKAPDEAKASLEE